MSALTAQVAARLNHTGGLAERVSAQKPSTEPTGHPSSYPPEGPVVSFVPAETTTVEDSDASLLKLNTPFAPLILRPRGRVGIGSNASGKAPSNGFACIVHEVAGEAEAYAATVLKAATGAPLVVWFTRPPLLPVELSPAWLRNLGAEADAIFAVSPTLRRYAERTLRRPVWVSPAALDQTSPTRTDSIKISGPHGVMLVAADVCESRIGELLSALPQLGRKLYWFTTIDAVRKTKVNPKGLAQAGVHLRLHATPVERENSARAAAFALWPSTLRNDSASAALRWLIPPSFLQTLVNGGPPPVVLAEDGGALAAFVQAHEIGEVCSYDATLLAHAAERISDPGVQLRYRQAMIRLGEVLRKPGADAYSLMSQAMAAGNWLDHPVQTLVFPRTHPA